MTSRSSPFHAGERAVQERAGVRERAELLGQHMFRSVMPEQHRAFFAQLPRMFVGSLDRDGQPWASILQGPPGFTSAPSETMLHIEAAPLAGDPLAHNLSPGQPLGLLGIQLETRRRNRVNGHIIELKAAGFSVRVDQSFGNCPKYITVRSLEHAPTAPAHAETLDVRAVPAAAMSCIARADTCFIASASAVHPANEDTTQGVDVSHRGGPSGFIEHAWSDTGELLLRIEDYPGNNAFNTLGNLTAHPKAGLLIPDFEHGHLLSLACSTTIRWQDTQRTLYFTVQRALYWDSALPKERA